MKAGIEKMEAEHVRIFSIAPDCKGLSDDDPVIEQTYHGEVHAHCTIQKSSCEETAAGKRTAAEYPWTALCITVAGLDGLATNDDSFLLIMSKFLNTCVELMT